MIEVNEFITIPDDEIHVEFVRSSGPGGQNVNKVSTAVQLRFNVRRSRSLPDDVRERLIVIAGKRATEAGEIVINASRYRTQLANRRDAEERLAELVRRACFRPRPRKRTRPTVGSREKRLSDKKRRSDTKRGRSTPDPDE